MDRQERVKEMLLTMEEIKGYDDTKPRSQLAFGRLLGFIIGGDPADGSSKYKIIHSAIHRRAIHSGYSHCGRGL